MFPRDCVLPRNQAGEFYISLRPSTFGKLAPTETQGNAPFGITKVVFPINPLLGAMGLVLTRLSRSSNTLKEVHWGWGC